ncbi:MAG: hypothetical protein PHV68_10100, partial [Candidatus Gastranaerophilales bacterium]|nr:hypothetical protein [Candidatus Gastranaerophilales bacterium]
DFGDEPKLYDKHPKHVPFTGSLAFKKNCLGYIKGFSEFASKIDKNITTNEDIILANELRNKGFKIVYNPKMVVYHKIQPEQMTLGYYKKRFYIGGRSDAYTYYLLGKFSKTNIPFKIILHFMRILLSLILKNLKTVPHEKYYQKLRYYYNSGYIKSLLEILGGRKNLEK